MKLANAFQIIQGHQITDEELYLDENEWLVFQGHYPTEPSAVYFELKYADEGGVWKLVGINVNIE